MASKNSYMQKNKVVIDGLKNIDVADPIMGQFIEQAGKVFIALAKSKIKVKTGNLRNSIGFIQRDKSGYGKPFRLIGARVYGEFKGYHAHLIEEGTTDRSKERKKNVTANGTKYAPNVGPAKPFMRPAFEQGKTIYTQILTKLTTDYIANKARKAGLKTK
jgi:hypothetical protein